MQKSPRRVRDESAYVQIVDGDESAVLFFSCDDPAILGSNVLKQGESAACTSPLEVISFCKHSQEDAIPMAQILIRGLDDQVVKALKAEARSHHRSLEAQVRSILASWIQMGDFRRYMKKSASKKNVAKSEASSAQIIRESRDAR